MNSTEMEIERININDLSTTEKVDLTQSIYAKKSYFQELFSQDTIELDMMELAQAFRQEITRMLIEKGLIKKAIELESLHECLSDEMKAYNFDDGVNKISTYFYETDDSFMKLYHRFMIFLRTHFVKEPFWFQKIPTLRIHCPRGLNSHHYPRYHTDIGYGHPPEEINIWIPFTRRLTGHGFRVMDTLASKQILEKFNYSFSDFIHFAIHNKSFSKKCDAFASPVLTDYGKLLAFDSRCIHTGEPLKWHTRISMDTRILPVSQYQKMKITYQGSGRRKIIFAPGHCYHEKDSDFLLAREGIQS